MKSLILRKTALGAAAAAVVLGAGAPAMAGKYYGHYGYHHGYYGKHYYGGHRHYRHRHKHGGGGKAAAIALGVIGGAIILNEIAEDKARRRYEEERYARYDRYRRYDPYSRRAAPYPTRYDPPVEEDAAPQDGNLSDDDLESRLDGGPEPIRISVASAYEACTRHARNALSNRGYVLSAPASPDTAEDLGSSWKMTATVLAEDRRGDSWSRAMYCEASEGRVYLLELI